MASKPAKQTTTNGMPELENGDKQDSVEKPDKHGTSGDDASSEEDLQVASLERGNYAGLCRLLVELSAPAMRHVFNGVYPPLHLAAALASPATHVTLRRMKVKGLVDDRQWEALYPDRKSLVSSQHYDAPLLFLLLKNICHQSPPYPNGWGGVPIQRDNSVPADLTRIQWFRTLLASREQRVAQKEFDDYWDQISDILIRLAGNKIRTRIQELHKRVQAESGNSRDEEQEQVAVIQALRQWEGRSTELGAREAALERGRTGRGLGEDLAPLPMPTHGRSHTLPPRSAARSTPPGRQGSHEARATGAGPQSVTAARSRGTGGVSRRHSNPATAVTFTKEEMRAHERAVIAKFYKQLTEKVKSDDVVPKLIQVGVLSHEEKNRISLATRNSDRMKLVLQLIQKKSGKTFDKFCDVIKYKYTSLYDQLLKAKQAPIVREKPDEVTQCANTLRGVYSQAYTVVAPVPWRPAATTTPHDFLQPCHITDFHGRTVDEADLLAPHPRCDLPKRVLVEGPGGCGRTTLLQSLALQWARGQAAFQTRFRLVFLLNLKGGVGVSGGVARAVAALLHHPHGGGGGGGAEQQQEGEEGEEEVRALLKRHEGHTLFLLDGYEDLAEEGAADSDVWDLIHRRLYPASGVVLAAHSAAVTPPLARHFDTRLQLLGLREGAQRGLIRAYGALTNAPLEGLAALLAKVENEADNAIRVSSRNPLQCLCLCLIQDTGGSLDLPTATALMQGFHAAIQKNFCKHHFYQTSEEDVPDDVKTFMAILQDLAFQVIQESRTVFHLDQLMETMASHNQPPANMDHLLKFGLISVISGHTTRRADKNRCQFHNRSVQEFLAAKHVYAKIEGGAGEGEGEGQGHLPALAAERHLHSVCAHFCGISRYGDSQDAVQTLFSLIGKTNRKYWRGGGGSHVISGVRRSSLAADHSASEVKFSDLSLSLEVVSRSEGRAEAVEAVSGSVPRRVYMRQREVYTSDMVRGLGLLLRGARQTALAQLELRLDHVAEYHEGAFTALAHAIQSSTHITALKLRWTREELLAAFLAEVFAARESSISALHVVDESRGGGQRDDVTATVWDRLRAAGQHMAGLRSLAFTHCHNPALVTSVLRNSPHTLESLSLRGSQLDVVGVQQLAAMVERSVTLTRLDLQSTRMKRGDFLHVTYGIKLTKSLSELVLADFDLDQNGGLALAEALKFCTTLRRVDLSRTPLSADLCRALGEALGANQSLLEVDLSGADLPEDGLDLLRKRKREGLVLTGLSNGHVTATDSNRRSTSRSSSTLSSSKARSKVKVPTVGTVTLLKV